MHPIPRIRNSKHQSKPPGASALYTRHGRAPCPPPSPRSTCRHPQSRNVRRWSVAGSPLLPGQGNAERPRPVRVHRADQYHHLLLLLRRRPSLQFHSDPAAAGPMTLAAFHSLTVISMHGCGRSRIDRALISSFISLSLSLYSNHCHKSSKKAAILYWLLRSEIDFHKAHLILWIHFSFLLYLLTKAELFFSHFHDTDHGTNYIIIFLFSWILLLLIHCSGAGDDDSGGYNPQERCVSWCDDDGDVKFFPRFFFCWRRFWHFSDALSQSLASSIYLILFRASSLALRDGQRQIISAFLTKSLNRVLPRKYHLVVQLVADVADRDLMMSLLWNGINGKLEINFLNSNLRRQISNRAY